ncbi:MAG TPA: CBS domain-containing protein [Nitrospinota bacterium]|jgi:CBS domain-containing protein|nr:CBS domain-containing protein [Nitrospinota bacterium]
MKRSEFLMGGKDVDKLTAGQAMENRVKSCHSTTPWQYIASALVDRGYGSLPVVDDDMNLIGIVSEDDLLQVLLEKRNEKDIKAEDMMTKNPMTVNEETPILDVIKMLEDHKLIRVPVVKESKLVGILTRRDVLFCYLQGTHKPPHGFGS